MPGPGGGYAEAVRRAVGGLAEPDGQLQDDIAGDAGAAAKEEEIEGRSDRAGGPDAADGAGANGAGTDATGTDATGTDVTGTDVTGTDATGTKPGTSAEAR